MAREKKISFKYFLNKSLKPVVIGGKTHYRVYVRISYDRLSTKFIFFIPDLPNNEFLTEDQFEEFFVKKTNKSVNEHVREFEEEIIKIVRFEAKAIGEKYRISGISNRQQHYYSVLLEELEKHLQKQLYEFSASQLPDKDLSAIFQNPMTLVESFGILENQIPDIWSKLPVRLVDRLTSYYHFHVFAQYYGKEIHCLDWLDLPTQVGFKELLFNCCHSDGFADADEHYHYFIFYHRIPPAIEKVPTYLKSIDKMLIEIIY